jgi:hypothetical protein
VKFTFHDRKGWRSGSKLPRIQKVSIQISAVLLAILTEGFRGFPESLHENSKAIPGLGAAASFQNDIHCPARHSTLFILDSDSGIKKHKK